MVAFTFHVSARDFYRIGQDYRSMAMGNTGIASANNSSALFYNPAAMSNIFTWWVDFPALQATYSDDAKDLYETLQNGLDLDTKDKQIEFMEDNIGKNPYLRINFGSSLFINMSQKGLTLGANYTYELIVDIEVRNASAPEITAYERLDLIRQVGISIPIGLGKWILGVNYKMIDRNELDFTYTIVDAANETNFPTLQDDGLKGSGGAFDVGFMYRTATKARIMFGGVWRNEVELGDASNIPTQLDLGMSMRQEYSIFRWIFALDLRDITRQLGSEDKSTSEKSIYRRLHIGTEVGIFPLSKNSSWISLRAGYNSGYLTWGGEIAFAHGLILGYTTYVEETGEYAGQKPSPRTAIYLSLGF